MAEATPEFKSINKSVKKTMDGLGVTMGSFFKNMTDSAQKALAQVGETKLSKEKQDAASTALSGQFKNLEELRTAIELNGDSLMKMAESNADAARLLELLKTEGFDELTAINQRMLNGQSVSGDQIKLMNSAFDSTNSVLQQMKDSQNIDNIKELNTLEFIKDSTEQFANGQAETQKLMDEQIYEQKTLREFIEENGILGEGGFGDSILALLGLGGLVGPFRKLIKIVKSLKTLKMADVIAKFAKFLKPFKFMAEVLKNFMKPIAILGKALIPFKTISKVLAKFGGTFPPVIAVFSKLKKVFAPVINIFSKVGAFFSKFSKALKPALKLGKTAAKFARGIPVIGQILTVLIGAFDFFTGFNNAEEISGKAKEALTTGDKIMSGISEMISSITFGFVDAKDIFKFIDNGVTKIIEGFTIVKDAVMNFFKSDFGKQVVDAFLVPFNLALDMVIGLGKTIWDSLSGAVMGIFNAKSIGDGLIAAFSGIASLWSGIGETVFNAISSAIKGLTFGAIDFGEIELPGFDEIVKKVKEILEKLASPFRAISDTFSGFFDKADDIEKTAKEGNSVLSSIGNFFGGKDDEDEVAIKEGKKSKGNVISLEERRLSLKSSPKDALIQDQQRTRQAQDKTIENKPQTVIVQGGGGQSAPAQQSMPASKQHSVDDIRLASANAGDRD